MIGTSAERLQEIDRLVPAWEPESIWSRFERSAGRFADNEYIVMEDVRLTYADTLRRVETVSSALYALGVRAGTHVAVRLSNCPEFVFLTFALSRLGAVKIPVNMQLRSEEFRHILRCAKAEYLISENAADLDEARSCADIRKTVLIGCPDPVSTGSGLSWEELISLANPADAAEAKKLGERPMDPEEVSDIMFTSGSTTLPKGAMLRGDGLQRSAFGSVRTRRFEIGRRMLVMVPLFHAFAYVEALLALPFVGGTLVMSRKKFETEYALELIGSQRINDIILLGIMMGKLTVAARERGLHFPDLHAVFFGENSLEWLWDDVRRVFELNDVTTGSGMTEVSGAAFMTTPDTPPEYLRQNYSGRLKEAGCAGIPEYGYKLMETKRVSLSSGALVTAPDETGELYYRGITVAKGYIGYTGEDNPFSSDGWFRSGDLWKLGEDGYSIYTGRLSDTYKINGENVSPKYLDEVIGKSPDVTIVSTVGVLNPLTSRTEGVAFIDPAQNNEETRKNIRCYCFENLAKYQMPRHFFFGDSRSWPRTGTNKISKKDLREWATELLRQQNDELLPEYSKPAE